MSETRSRWIAPAAAALGGLLVGALVGLSGWLDGAMAPDPKQTLVAQLETLPETPVPDVATELDNARSWLLGEIDDKKFIATTGDAVVRENVPPLELCFSVVDSEGFGSGTCTTFERFAEHGMWISSSGPSGSYTYYWPPSGPPGMVVCVPDLWPPCH